MTQAPPVPAGNLSPYPQHQPADAPRNKALDQLKAKKKAKKSDRRVGAIVVAALGASIVTAAAGYLLTARPPAKKKGRKRK